MAEITLQAEIRPEKSTKKALTDLRKSKRIPAVVYGGKGTNLILTVSEKELLAALKVGGANAIIHLKHAKGEDTVILKALQRHVVTSQPIHADFQRISMKEKIEVKVPLRIVGEAVGVRHHGGVLEHPLRELRVRCLPNAIPQSVELDVSSLDVGQNVTVAAVKVPAGVEVLDDPHHIVASVVHATEEAAPAAAPAGPAEPEVIAKGKKDEEGEGAGAKGEAPKADAKAKPEAKGKPEAKKDEGKKEK